MQPTYIMANTDAKSEKQSNDGCTGQHEVECWIGLMTVWPDNITSCQRDQISNVADCWQIQIIGSYAGNIALTTIIDILVGHVFSCCRRFISIFICVTNTLMAFKVLSVCMLMSSLEQARSIISPCDGVGHLGSRWTSSRNYARDHAQFQPQHGVSLLFISTISEEWPDQSITTQTWFV